MRLHITVFEYQRGSGNFENTGQNEFNISLSFLTGNSIMILLSIIEPSRTMVPVTTVVATMPMQKT